MRFFKPAWMSDNKEKALEAVKKEDNQAKLLEIANNATNYIVRLRAAEKIRAPKLLAVFLKDNTNYEKRFEAIEKLTDQAILAYMAKHAYSDMRLKAAEKITDQALLADVANSDNFYDVCFEAAKKLKDQTLAQKAYTDVAKKAFPGKRLEAIERLTDQKVLAEVAKNDPDEEVRRAAAEKLTTQTALAERAALRRVDVP